MRPREGQGVADGGMPATTAGDAAATLPDDETLGRALRDGDLTGAEGLYKRYVAELHDLAARIVRDSTRAEDAVQTAFVLAMERASTLRDPAKVKSWLFTITVNVARQMVGRGPKYADTEVPEALEATEAGPEEVAVLHSTQELVLSAMDGLEPRQRVALDLTARHGLSTSEVGTVLGLPTAHAAVVVHRAQSAFRHSMRSLLIAQSRTHCDALATMVPHGVRSLNPLQRRRVEAHLRHCGACHTRAAVLTSSVELLGGIALLPLPARLTTDWLKRSPHPPPAVQVTAARFPALWRWRLLIAGGFGVALFSGGLGLVILHNGQQPARLPQRGTLAIAATPAPSESDLPTPSPTDTPAPTPTPPDGAAEWAAAQDFVRQAKQYHVHWAAQDIASNADPRQPSILDLQVQPNGDITGTYTAIGGFIGDFQLRRVGGILSVRNINLFGNFGGSGAPRDAIEFFGLTSDQTKNLGTAWLPLTASAQQPAARVIGVAIAPFVNPSRLANGPLAPPPPAQLDAGGYGGPDVELVMDGAATLWFLPTGGAYVELHTPAVALRVDHFG